MTVGAVALSRGVARRVRRPAAVGRLVAAAVLVVFAAAAGAAGETPATRALPLEPPAAPLAAAAPAPEPPKVDVDLISEVAAVAPGETFWVGLRQRIAPGWHTYWTNPGDSGEPATIEWALPEGFQAGEIAWPHPHRIPVGPVMTYGYTDEVVLLVPITAPRDLEPGGRVTLRGQMSWLVCAKVCIPEEAPVELTLPVGPATPDPDGARVIAAARRAVPLPSPWPVSFTATDDTLTLTVAATGLERREGIEAWFYPSRWGVIDQAAPQQVDIGRDGITVRVARGPLPEAVREPVDGVLVLTERLDGGTASQAFALRATPAGTAAAGVSLAHALLLALAGGLVLNLMPCVLPVLSVKVLALVHHAGASAAALRAHGAAYTAGVLASFAVLAGVLVALRAAGEQLGWGFQLQSPVFVTLLAYVLFTMALSLSGVVVIGGGMTGMGDRFTRRSGYAGSFAAGALATVAATPCTAPFMGVAVGFALTQRPAVALAVFEALALGLALPFLLLTLVPAWRRFLPRPGPWMERLEQFLAFPLYATVAWLVWVLSQQAGPTGVAVALGGLVLIAFGAWLFSISRAARTPWRQAATAGVVTCALAAIALGPVAGAGAPDASSPGSATASGTDEAGARWEPFSPARLAALREQGTPVFVNFTAAWCITCLVNERVALRSAAVSEAFARKGVVYLKADWTNRDPEIARVLATFGRSGVPLYLLYPPSPSAAPAVLPQILTEGTIIEAVEKEIP